MNPTYQRISEEIAQIQVDLEGVLKLFFEQAGSKLQPEQQGEMEQSVEGTKQMLERLRVKYS